MSEICEISLRVRTKTNIMNGIGKGVFVAVAIGQNGSHVVGESSTIDLTKTNWPWIDEKAEDRRGRECLAALEQLTKELLNDGWVYVGLFGDGRPWRRRFEKKVTNGQ
jgi:hypothetical protein